jgi:hypothetical protein
LVSRKIARSDSVRGALVHEAARLIAEYLANSPAIGDSVHRLHTATRAAAQAM